MKFCCFRPSALLAPGFYPILAPEQQRITNANCSAPPLHFVSLRCSVLALSQSFRFASFFARAKTRQLRNILRARFAPCFGHIERRAALRFALSLFFRNSIYSQYQFLKYSSLDRLSLRSAVQRQLAKTLCAIWREREREGRCFLLLCTTAL